MERYFDQDLQQLKERILYMGSLAETMIHIAIKALVDRRKDSWGCRSVRSQRT